MHDDDRLIQPRQAPKPRNGLGPLGGILAALAVLALKFKALLGLLFSFKFLFVLPKLLLSFSSMFLSIWLYAVLFGGWKIGIVFVLMILVHELGHYLTWRNFGVPANLPMFIPGLGAFVSSPTGGTPAQNVASSVAGPLFGIAAAAACWAYGSATGERFWYACAYIGFFLNFINLLPIPPLDGGSIAGAIDARLWYLGIPLFLALIFFTGVTPFSILFIILVFISAVPRLLALYRGQLNPLGSGLTPLQRTVAALAYFGLALAAIAGAAATHITRAAA